MKNKLLKLGKWALIILFWLSVWEISALIINVRFIFPTLGDVLLALFSNAALPAFWLSIALTFVRIIFGLLIGVIIAIPIAWICTKLRVVYEFIKPIVAVIRSTPVASFIMILWLLISDGFIPSLIAILIVFPVIFESAYAGFSSPRAELIEMAEVFGFSEFKKAWYITLPSMIKYTLPSIITASGLAWKSGVAAEIITQTTNSIGREIAISKNLLEGDDLFAWTAVVVILSIIVENIIKHLSERTAAVWE